jgi:hypothetical protein
MLGLQKLLRRCLLVVLASIVVAAPAFAYTDVQGQIAMVEVVGSGAGAPGNFDLRVFLTGYPVLCNGQNWAYINTTDTNYQGLLASVLMAKATGATVTLHVYPSGSYCALGYLDIL